MGDVLRCACRLNELDAASAPAHPWLGIAHLTRRERPADEAADSYHRAEEVGVEIDVAEEYFDDDDPSDELPTNRVSD